MADFDLNLSTQPFPAYRLINIALVCVLVALVAISVWQVSGFMEYSKMAQSIRAEEQQSRVQAQALGKQVAELETRLDRPESAAKLNEIQFLNALILQKDFSWTKLFGVLEKLLPENIHFTNLAPSIQKDGSVLLRLTVEARGMTDVKEFLQRLEQSPLFADVKVSSESKEAAGKEAAAIATPAAPGTDLEVILTATYYPQRDQ